jgi:hypothetical protein
MTVTRGWRIGLIALFALSIVASCAIGRQPSDTPLPRPRFSFVPIALASGSVEPPAGPPASIPVLPPTEDPNATLPPFPTSHGEPALDTLIGIEVSGVRLQTASLAGDAAAAGGGYLQPLLASLGKTNADLSTAIAEDPSRGLDVVVFAVKIRGANPDDLLGAFLRTTVHEDAEAIDFAGKRVRRILTGWTSYVYAWNDVLIIVQAPDVVVAEEALRQLP